MWAHFVTHSHEIEHVSYHIISIFSNIILAHVVFCTISPVAVALFLPFLVQPKSMRRPRCQGNFDFVSQPSGIAPLSANLPSCRWLNKVVPRFLCSFSDRVSLFFKIFVSDVLKIIWIMFYPISRSNQFWKRFIKNRAILFFLRYVRAQRGSTRDYYAHNVSGCLNILPKPILTLTWTTPWHALSRSAQTVLGLGEGKRGGRECANCTIW